MLSDYDRRRIIDLLEQESQDRQQYILSTMERLRQWVEWALRILGIVRDVWNAIQAIRAAFGY